MRRLLSLVFAAALLVAGPAAAQAAWANYKNVEHGFSADMPGAPQVSQQTDPEIGTQTLFAAGGPEGAFLVSAMKLPKEMLAEPQALDLFLTGVIQGAEAVETSRTTTTISGVEARAATVKFKGDAVGDIVAVIHGERVYAFFAMRRADGDPAQARRFLSSLRLLD